MRWHREDSGKMSSGNEILMDKKALPLSLALERGVRVTQFMGSKEESQHKHTNLRERRQTESENATVPSVLSLRGIVIFSLPSANHNQILLHFT